MNWWENGEGLEERLVALHDQIRGGTYRARPSKRVWIPKGEGKLRPIGIAALEDKIVQQALVDILQTIYEEDFQGFSYGYLQGFFDSLDHEWLMRFVEHRVADPRVLRLIRKFLRAGVSEDGKWSKTAVGTPQGAVISPLLANIYLHYVLDLWVQWWRAHRARGEVYIVRYCDDFVMGFQYHSDARLFQIELAERLVKFGLELHQDKTRLIEFGRFAASNRQERGEGKPETFDFLGFTHVCARKRKDGSFTLRRKTIGKRLREKVKSVREMLMRNRHRPVAEQARWLRAVVQGHFNYYGVPGNRKALEAFRTLIGHAWLRALRRRSQKGRKLTWQRMQGWMERWLPRARASHPYPNQRLCV